MTRKRGIVAVLFILTGFSCFAQVTLSGSNPAPFFLQSGSTVQITGSFTVARTNPSTTNCVVDLTPSFASNLRKNWTRVADTTSTTVLNASVYMRKNVGSDEIYQWGPSAAGSEDANVQAANIYTIALPDNTPVTQSYSVAIYFITTPAAGMYYTDVVFRVRATTFPKTPIPDVVTSLPVRLVFYVGKVTTLALEAVGGGPLPGGGVSFTDVTASTDANFQIKITTTSFYKLYARSTNAGKIVHATQPTQKIPYTLTIGTTSVPLGTANTEFTSLQQPPNNTSISTIILASKVTIGSFASYLAGTYTDNITFTVVAQ